MANINAPSVEYFQSFANEIIGKFRRLNVLVSHSVSIGNYHEEIIRSTLKNFLSKRFSVKTGFMFRSSDEVSRQLDIMVIDENDPAAYIFQEADFAVVRPESVVAVIEIKTSINAREFEAAMLNIRSAKTLAEFPANLTGILFSYDGTQPNSTNLNKWFSRNSLSCFSQNEVQAPDSIIFFKKKKMLLKCRDDMSLRSDGDHYRFCEASGEIANLPAQLSIMLAMIINACEKKDFRRRRHLGRGKANDLAQMSHMELDSKKFMFKPVQADQGRH